MTKQLFIESIEAFRLQRQHDENCLAAFSIILPNCYVSYYDNSFLLNQAVKLLKIEFMDNHDFSWIDYFIEELQFGSKYKIGCALHKDGTNIDLSTSANLYDFLLKEMGGG